MHWAARACTIKLSYSLEEQRENEQTSKASSRLVISRHRTCKCAGIIESTNESKNLTSVSANDLGICSSSAGIRASYGKSSPVSRHWKNNFDFKPNSSLVRGWLPHLLDLLDHDIISRSKEQVILQKIRAQVVRTGAYRTGIGLLVIIQSKSRIISAGAFVERISGRRSLGDSIALTGPRRRLRCVNLLAKQVYSAQNF